MSVQDLVHAIFPPADVAKVNTSLDDIKTAMPFLTPLSSEQKSSIIKMGDSYTQFVNRAIEAVTSHPEIVSGTFDKEELQRDVELVKALKPIQQKVALLLQAIDDTISAAGSDALVASLEIYSEVKKHTNSIAGFTNLASEMQQYFPRKKKAAQPVQS